MDILIYNRKHLHSDEEKLFYARFSRIRTEGNISNQNPQYFENNKNGHNKLIEDLKKHLVYNIDRISFSKNPFHKWIGEIKEILPNDMINIKISEYDWENDALSLSDREDIEMIYKNVPIECAEN